MVPRTCYELLTLIPTESLAIGTLFISTLQMRKMILREVYKLELGHTSSKWGSRAGTKGVWLQSYITMKTFCQLIYDLIDNNSEMFLRNEILHCISSTALFSYHHLSSLFYNTFLAAFHVTRHLLFKFTTASRIPFGSYHSCVKTGSIQFTFRNQLILLSVAYHVPCNLTAVQFSLQLHHRQLHLFLKPLKCCRRTQTGFDSKTLQELQRKSWNSKE